MYLCIDCRKSVNQNRWKLKNVTNLLSDVCRQRFTCRNGKVNKQEQTEYLFDKNPG